MDLEDLVSEVDELVEKFLKNMEKTNAAKLGLDPRAGRNLYFNNECIGVRRDSSDMRALEYYGGFEYIDTESRLYVGDYVFYFDADRVDECIEYFYQQKQVVIEEKTTEEPKS